MSDTARRGVPPAATLAVGFLAVAVACTTPSSAPPPPGTSGAPPSGSGATSFTVLTRDAHPFARADLDVGRLDPARHLGHLSIVFKPSGAQISDRDALAEALLDPGSPSYHHWLTPETYAARFGAKTDDVARTAAWLTSQGLVVSGTPSRLGARVTFSGTVAAIEAAFRTEMHVYRVGGETHYAMARPPSVPSDLADVILAIHNTHDFYARPAKPTIKLLPSAVCPPGGDCTAGADGIAPPDWATIYDVNSLYSPGLSGTLITGSGVTIAVVGVTEISQTDLTAFRTRYGLATNPITMTLVPDTGAAQPDNGAGLEGVLDTEWSGAIAPSASINYVYTGANDGNVDDAAYYAIEQNYGGVLTESYAQCEGGFTPGDADVLGIYGSAANLLGITYLAASGDAGAAACVESFGVAGLYVNMPAAFPGVTAVGGTGFAIPGGLTFNALGNATGYGTESVWNEFNNPHGPNGIYAGGGGISSVFARPSYQSSVSTCTILGSLPTTVTPSSMRQVPDVALNAAAGASQYGYFIECTLDGMGQDCTDTGSDPIVIEIGGTSASTPSFAGVIALANQATGGRLGNINPLLYTLSSSVPTAFHDVTTGNNEIVCKSGTDPGCPAGDLYGYAATTGYDCASGLGSIDATNLVTAWATMAPTATTISPSTSSTSEGTSVTLAATIDVTTSNPNVLGGTVTFTFQSYLANGSPDLSWTLGTGTVTGTTTSGTGSLSTIIPPGLVKPGQAVDVVAQYGGDANHLASSSTKSTITFSPASTFCVTPSTDSVKGGASLSFAASGGVSPVTWHVRSDSTCTDTYWLFYPLPASDGCSALNESTGAFTAGKGAAGYVLVQAIDADGAEAFAEITVGSPSAAAPWAGDAGIIPGTCCTPVTTCPGGDDCGTISDGCGGYLSCGPACAAPLSCGGGGTPNVCGCTTLTSCPGGDNCGTISNGCGGYLSCGAGCTAPQTCAGGGTPNVCGCTPLAACPGGDVCGTVPDGCGGVVTCAPGCSGTETCSMNQCVAGPDSGPGDSGTGSDSGTPADSGSGDSGSGVDSGSGGDSGGVDCRGGD